MWSTSQPGVEESRGRMRLVTPEPRELAECGLPRSRHLRHLRVSEGPPLAPQSWPSIMGAILLLRAGPGRPRPREGVGTAFGTLSKYSLRGACSLSLPHRAKQECRSKSYPGGTPGTRLLVFSPNLSPASRRPKCLFGGLDCLLHGSSMG
uniref:Uncharacterized protein n=1 Tax=Mus spicilegus TaxID=10103 RepID=A0A8C6HAH0_MUSSI